MCCMVTIAVDFGKPHLGLRTTTLYQMYTPQKQCTHLLTVRERNCGQKNELRKGWKTFPIHFTWINKRRVRRALRARATQQKARKRCWSFSASHRYLRVPLSRVFPSLAAATGFGCSVAGLAPYPVPSAPRPRQLPAEASGHSRLERGTASAWRAQA